ncbi:MAG: hypothetical protein ACO38R_07720, partial [Ilumatobacteraceae bacterium]
NQTNCYQDYHHLYTPLPIDFDTSSWFDNAGLAAHGETVIGEIHHIDRGYDDLVGRLSGLGADITRV